MHAVKRRVGEWNFAFLVCTPYGGEDNRRRMATLNEVHNPCAQLTMKCEYTQDNVDTQFTLYALQKGVRCFSNDFVM